MQVSAARLEATIIGLYVQHAGKSWHRYRYTVSAWHCLCKGAASTASQRSQSHISQPVDCFLLEEFAYLLTAQQVLYVRQGT
jgi:hypothetical protein